MAAGCVESVDAMNIMTSDSARPFFDAGKHASPMALDWSANFRAAARQRWASLASTPPRKQRRSCQRQQAKHQMAYHFGGPAHPTASASGLRQLPKIGTPRWPVRAVDCAHFAPPTQRTRRDGLVHCRSVPLPVALGGDDYAFVPPAAPSSRTGRLSILFSLNPLDHPPYG